MYIQRRRAILFLLALLLYVEEVHSRGGRGGGGRGGGGRSSGGGGRASGGSRVGGGSKSGGKSGRIRVRGGGPTK